MADKDVLVLLWVLEEEKKENRKRLTGVRLDVDNLKILFILCFVLTRKVFFNLKPCYSYQKMSPAVTDHALAVSKILVVIYNKSSIN